VFGRRIGDRLDVTTGPDAPVYSVSISGFAFVSALRCCNRGELLVTAVAAGDRVPDVRNGYRGEMRLYRCDAAEGVWRRIGPGYAHDPVCLPGGRYAVHRGAGLSFLDSAGSIFREVKVGRFGWGPPSLSVSPDGRFVAWVRWRGDDRKVRVEEIATGISRQFRPSVYRYAWLDEQTLIYILGDGPRLLNLESGATRRFGRRLRGQALRGIPGAPAELQEIARLPEDELFEIYGEVRVVDGDVWLAATLTRRDGSSRVDGLFRSDATGDHLHMVTCTVGRDRIEAFTPFHDRSLQIRIATYEGTTVVDRRDTAVGPLAAFLNDGWMHLLDSHQPDFGFHRLP